MTTYKYFVINMINLYMRNKVYPYNDRPDLMFPGDIIVDMSKYPLTIGEAEQILLGKD